MPIVLAAWCILDLPRGPVSRFDLKPITSADLQGPYLLPRRFRPRLRQSSRSISTSAFSSCRMMKLRQKIFGGFGSDRAGVDPAERVAAGDLGRRGTIRPQSNASRLSNSSQRAASRRRSSCRS